MGVGFVSRLLSAAGKAQCSVFGRHSYLARYGRTPAGRQTVMVYCLRCRFVARYEEEAVGV